ncbi:MazG nucleotide pyrophosphohydrolase domain-containing protein [Lysinibacillus fusiformis]|nr:MazG nucleotide pyrophosphohydrolase domain-containing protein [Lysinibacillus fusiformis]
MRDIQAYLSKFQKDMNWEISEENYKESKASLLHNYMLLTTEVSEVAEEFRSIFNKTYRMVNNDGLNEEDAFKIAKDLHKENIGKELSDCIAYLVKFANYLDIDLEDSFYKKMEEVKLRVNKDQR